MPMLFYDVGMDPYFDTNKTSWNLRVQTHFDSKFYDVPGFLAGKTSLNIIEREGLPVVSGKQLLHLQCHFGLDSLSLARMGAQVTGVDISDQAIAKAQLLQQQTQLDATFVCQDVYTFGKQSKQLYDIVYTSYGAICWLPDLNLWAQIIAKQLKTGGQFYMAEFHPILDLLAGYSYFHQQKPDISSEGTYTENCDGSEHQFAVWSHPISDVISALINAGLLIEKVEEFDYSPYNCFENMYERTKGEFCLKHKDQLAPMVYSVLATKPRT
ncbi:MAG: class I SAM-dependent methyltransferase [Marinicella sp.]